MNLKTRRNLIYSKAASIAMHGIKLYIGQNERTIDKISSILMKCNRAIFLGDFFLVSNSRICRQISVDLPSMIIKKSALRFIHKAIINEKPTQIFEKLRFNNCQRNCSKIALREGFSKDINKQTLIYKSVELYNKK